MKWFGTSIVILVFLMIAIVLFRGQSSLKNISSYRIYYGRMNDEILEDMKKYDLVVVEALRFNEDMVNELKTSGVMVLGYISVSEVGWWDDEIVSQMDSSQFLFEEGKPLMNGKNKLGDLSSLHYRTVLLNTIEKRIMSKGMDGVFFDTLDTVDVIESEDGRYAQIMGYLELVSDIRLKWNDIVLIQNRGFNYTSFLQREMIDGILWENFSEDLFNDPVYRIRRRSLNRLRWIANVHTLALAYRDEEASKAAASRNRWIFSYLKGQEGLMEWETPKHNSDSDTSFE